MRLTRVTVRDFRCYERAAVSLGPGLTVITGPNGAGKTNLLDALYFGCTGRSCRTSNERELIRFGQGATRVVATVSSDDGEHELSCGFSPGEVKRMTADGAPVQRLLDVAQRPLISVFDPDRLELIKGAPAVRRAHIDQFVAALWPARTTARKAYAQALAQRNALISRVRGEGASDRVRAAFEPWDLQLAGHGIELMGDRRAALDAVSEPFAGCCDLLGLDGEPRIAYRPRSRAATAQELVAELAERLPSDLERGFSGHGPHRDDVSVSRGGRELRNYGSQGQQRLALLGWLLAEREALADRRESTPLMLLDDVMSELDGARREALIELLRSGDGQSVITATEPEQVPGAEQSDVQRLEVRDGVVAEVATAGH
jgi:DNA replication and repair protein RecF